MKQNEFENAYEAPKAEVLNLATEGTTMQTLSEFDS